MARSRWTAVAIAAAAVLGAASSASAHAVLARSAPPAGASLSAAPAAVILEFSEPVAPGLSTATVTDGTGAVVSTASSLSADRRTLTVSLHPLRQGVYTVRWRVLSTADGHATTGFFLFAVGQPLGRTAGGGTAAAPPSPAQVALRWVNFSAAIFLAGLALFSVAMLRPSLAHLDPPAAVHASDAVRALRRAEVAAAAVLAAGTVGEFVLQASALLDAPPLAVWRTGLGWTMLGGTKTGWSVLVRLAGAAMLLVPPTASGRLFRVALVLWCAIVGAVTALFGGPAALAGSSHLPVVVLVAVVYGLLGAAAAVVIPLVPGVRVPALWASGPLAAGAILAGMTVNSHAAAVGLAASAVDWVHLAAAGAWVGGLPALWLAVRVTHPSARPALAAALVPRFSRLAGASLLVLVVTGAYSALVHVPAVRALAVTPYGRLLAAKLVFVLGAAALGAYNRLVLRPRLAAHEGERAVRSFLRTVAGEISLGAAVLLVVAALTITPPASVTLPAAPRQPPLALAGMAGPFRVDLTVIPAQPGWNRLEAVVRGPEGPLDPLSARVLVRALKLDEDVSPLTITLQPQGGRFVAEGGELGLAGVWELQVVVRRRGVRDETTTFPLLLGSVPNRPSDPQALRALEQALQAASRVRTWREREQIADGVGGVAVTELDLVRPDRLRFRTGGGNEAVIIGSTRYFRTAGGPWEKDTLPSPVSLQGPFATYLQEPQGTVLGRPGRCGDESCRAVLWRSPGGTAVFAAWVGEKTYRVYRLLMVALAHYMTTEAYDHDAPLRIAPP